MKSRRKRSRYARLPPHSNEAYPLTALGEVRKPVIIAIITVVAIVILSLLLFFSGQFVGKAISYGALNANEAGIQLTANTITDGQTFPLTVKANIGTAQTVAIEFQLNLPTGITCNGAGDGVESLLGWTDGVVVSDARCVTDDPVASGSYVLFSYATLNTDDAKTGAFDIATVTLTETGDVNSYALTFPTFTIINLDDAAAALLALEIINPTIQIQVPGAETHSCTGDVPVNAIICPDLDEERDLLVDTPRTLVAECAAATKCEYTCIAGHHIDADGVCVADVPAPLDLPPAPPVPEVAEPAGSSGSGGGSARCVQRWTCVGQWSYCNATLQQSRSCYDRENCPNLPVRKLENRSCVQCDESWVCTEWSACQSGIQTRDCTDEHSCSTLRTKPVEQKSCQETVIPGPTPARVIQQAPPSLPPVVQQPAPIAIPSFWEKYKIPLIASGSGLLVLVAIILLVVHFVKPQQLVYNIEELKEWVRKEREIGTSDADIKKILAQHTGWKEQEIKSVL